MSLAKYLVDELDSSELKDDHKFNVKKKKGKSGELILLSQLYAQT
jgi:hypothetical protein